MNELAQVRSGKVEHVVSSTWFLPALLAANTSALLAIDRLGGIPAWLKSAVALFLSF